jgi:Asp-tRNA(Asn)/Glu-tRNA(Gln) amidotransferase A subunit family amidase
MNEALNVRQCVERIAEGTLTSEKLVTECLKVIDETDGNIGAWAFLDRDYALTQAKSMDDIRRHGRPLGALHGIPVGLKDIIDTKDLPTERGCEAFRGHQPKSDAAIVERLKEAGAVILGKTVTTECAYLSPSTTRNPHNPAYTPGGSSSGSAAAVAAGQAPLAIGTQTNGSVIRPASFCGVYGYKPSAGVISRRGVFQTSWTLDQIGVFAQNAGDAALLCDVLAGFDAGDTQSYLAPRPKMLNGYLTEAPIEPCFAVIELPYDNLFDENTRFGMQEVADVFGKQVEKIAAPSTFVDLIECQKTIHEYEMSKSLTEAFATNTTGLSDILLATLQRANQISYTQYNDALQLRHDACDWFEKFFYDYDAIITPAALGEAPQIDDGTGNPICSTIWTLCGLPNLSMPILHSENDLPIGVQLIGNLNEDDRLLRTANWFLNTLQADEANLEEEIT